MCYKIFLLFIRFWGTTSYSFCTRLWTPCGSVMQRIWFRKWNMLHTIWNHFWITLGILYWQKEAKIGLPHNFALRCYPYFAVAICCIYFLSHRIPDATTFKRSHLIFFFFFSIMLEQEEYAFLEFVSIH